MFRASTPLWKIYFILGSIALGLYALRPSAGVETGLVFVYGLAATAAVFFGVWRYHPQPLPAWILLGISQGLITTGDLIFAQGATLHLNIVDLRIQAGFYILALGCMLAGILLVARAFWRLVTRETLMNGFIVMVGLGVAIWLLHIAPSFAAPLDLIQWADRVALPLLLVFILAPAVVLVMTPLGHTLSCRFLVLSACLYAVATSFCEFSVQAGNVWLGSEAALKDALLSGAHLLVGMALLHPSIAHFRLPVLTRSWITARLERYVLSICMLLIPVTFIFLRLMGRTIDSLFAVVSMAAVSMLVVWRYNHMANGLEAQNRQLKWQKDRMTYQAHTDALTTLPNRFFLYQYLSEVVDRACQSGQQGAVLMIDLNRFKEVNDTFGHDAGDRTLKEIANLFIRQKRKSDVVARWGGDEFIYILEDVGSEANVLTFARRLHNEVTYQVEMHGQVVTISLSIGICLFPLGGRDVHTIVKNSDIALYRAKKINGEKISLYNQ